MERQTAHFLFFVFFFFLSSLISRTYHSLSSKLADAADELCQGRIVFLLEGGCAFFFPFFFEF